MVGGQYRPKPATLPFRIDGCPDDLLDSLNITMTTNSTLPRISPAQPTEETLRLFRVSFMYYPFIGMMIVLVVGYSVSLLTGGYTVEDERLIAPFRRKSDKIPIELSVSKLPTAQNLQYLNIDEAREKLNKQ